MTFICTFIGGTFSNVSFETLNFVDKGPRLDGVADYNLSGQLVSVEIDGSFASNHGL